VGVRVRLFFRLLLVGLFVILGTVFIPNTFSSSVISQSNASALPINGPLRISADNPRYFAGPDGTIVYLTGSHTWQVLQDIGTSDPPAAWNYTDFLQLLNDNNHNFFRMWVWEHPRDEPKAGTSRYFDPLPFARTGPGTAADGKPRFDLTQLNQAYFDRLRARVQAARDRGIYVAVMLFEGWSVDGQRLDGSRSEPLLWNYHPFHESNNINGIDADSNNDSKGYEVHTLSNSAITSLQKAYVRKVIETVNDLDNVLYEICNECDNSSIAWQYELINYIKSEQATLAKQHPVGMTFTFFPGNNDALYNSPADWISYGGTGDIVSGTANPPAVIASRQKVIVADTDHFCGICFSQQERNQWVSWVWRSFTRGENPIIMDVYQQQGYLLDDMFERDPSWGSFRRNLGYTLNYAQRMNLKTMVPNTQVSSTSFALANLANSDPELLIFAPNGGTFTVNLSGISGSLQSEWLNPQTGQRSSGAAVNASGNVQLSAPFSGAAVLYLARTIEEAPPTLTPSTTLTPSITRTPSATPTRSPVPTSTATRIPATATNRPGPPTATNRPGTPTATNRPGTPTATNRPGTPTQTPIPTCIPLQQTLPLQYFIPLAAGNSTTFPPDCQ
jgi:hypothetical protein